VGCGGGGGGSSGGSNPAQGVYRGVVSDEDGNPVAGARVSIDGIEANVMTGADGAFVVDDGDLATASIASLDGARVAGAAVDVQVSVLAPGFAPFVSSLLVDEGDLANVDLVRLGLEPHVTIASPTPGGTFVLDSGCEVPAVTVDGIAALGVRDSFRLDVAIVVDRSGSTADPAFDVDGDGSVDTVLDAEIAAVECFVAGLDPQTTRASVISFNDAANTVVDFTDDMDALGASLAGVGPSSGGTNFEAGFVRARELLEALAASDAARDPAEESGALPPAPFRAVVFVSDGIATSHGVPRNMADSNITQSPADRHAAMDAAQALGVATGAQLFAFSILSPMDGDKKRTTLPHCVALCGGGRYESLDSAEDLGTALCGESLVSLLSVEIVNLTLGGDPVTVALRADGSFSHLIPVAAGPAEVVGAPAADGTVENVIQVTLTAFSGAMMMSDTQSVAIRVIDEPAYQALGTNELLTAQAAASPVAATSRLNRPTGGPLGDMTLYNFLVGAATAEFEDAHELLGVQTFTAAGGLSSTVTLSFDLVFKEACYTHDVGYFLYNPADPPRSVVQLLRSLTSANILFNTADGGTNACSGQSIAVGDATRSVTFDSGTVLAFFIIPNRTLAQYQANPRNGDHPLFSLNSLNPGNFDQALTFRSVNGRTESGASTTVVSPGPLMVFAFDDQSAAGNQSDQDFDDIVFTVSAAGVARAADAECADD
jgi:hypothetical protein